MVRIEVVAVDGVPPVPKVAIELGTEGGTIGRADSNHLCLPDPNRTISRVQAQIVNRQGTFKLIARGSNPLLVDGSPLEIGEEAPLAATTTIETGAYRLIATVGGATGSRHP